MHSYAGIPMSETESSEVAVWIAENIKPHELFPLAYRSWPGLITNGPVLNVTPEEPLAVRIGSLFWPRDASRFARAHFVVTSQQLAQIRSQVFQNGSQAFATLSMNDGRNAIYAYMWMLPAIPLQKCIPNPTPAAQNMYLLTLVDDRYWWWGKAVDLTVVDGTTEWEELYADLASALDDEIVVDPIADDYGSPTSDYETGSRPVPPILDAVAWSLQQRIVRDLNGTVKAQNYATAKALVTANRIGAIPYAGGEFDLTATNWNANDLATLPATVEVAFPVHGTANTFFAITVRLADLALPQFVNITGTPWVKLLHRYEEAVIPNVIPTNLGVLTALATQFATDWYLWQLAPLDQYYAGIVPWVPDGFHDIEWRQQHGKITTHVQRGKFNPVEDLLYGFKTGCEDRLVAVCPEFGTDGVLLSISNKYQRYCNGVEVGDPYCIINPSPCCEGGSGISGSGVPETWWCVRVQQCSDPACIDDSCLQPSGVECVNFAFSGPGDSRCEETTPGLYRKETALSGPYATEGNCQVACGGITVDCPCSPMPQNLCVIFRSVSNCACIDGEVIDAQYIGLTTRALTGGPSSQPWPAWYGCDLTSCGLIEVLLRCIGGQWYFETNVQTTSCGNDDGNPSGFGFSSDDAAVATVNCSPLHLQSGWMVNNTGTNLCGSGNATVQVNIIAGPCPGSDDPPTATVNTDDLCQDAASFQIAGTNFDTTVANNLVYLNLGAIGHCTSASATLMTVVIDTVPTSTGVLTAIVVNGAGSSAPAVQVATVIDCGVAGTWWCVRKDVMTSIVDCTGSVVSTTYGCSNNAAFTMIGDTLCVNPVFPETDHVLWTAVGGPFASAGECTTSGCNGDCSFATLVWEDTFTDADGTLLTAHTPDLSPGGAGYANENPGANRFRIKSNQLGETNNALSDASAASFDPGEAISKASIDFVYKGAPFIFLDLIPRYDGSGDFTVGVQNTGGGTELKISTPDGDASASLTLVDGNTYTLEVINNETSITATCDGVTITRSSSASNTNTKWAIVVLDEGVVNDRILMDNLNVYSCE